MGAEEVAKASSERLNKKELLKSREENPAESVVVCVAHSEEVESEGGGAVSIFGIRMGGHKQRWQQN